MTENDITRNWNEQLRQQLADHQEAAPEDLWSRIEQRLDAESSSTPHAEEAASVLPARKRTFTLRRWAVAASLALLLGGASLYFYRHQTTPFPSQPQPKNQPQSQPQSPQLAKSSGQSSSIAVANDNSSQASVPKQVDEPASHVKGADSRSSLLAQLNKSTQSDVQPVAGLVKESSPVTENKQVTQPDQVAQPEPVEELNQVAESNFPRQPVILPPSEDNSEVASLPLWLGQGSGSEWEFALFAQNTLVASQQSTPVFMSDNLYYEYNNLINQTDYFRRGAPSSRPYLTQYREQTHHHLPLSVGISVSYSLSNRLALQSGIVYTRAASEFLQTMQGTTLTTQQRLHYVGIPFHLRYNLWQPSRIRTASDNGFTLYGIAGTQADVNVKATRTVEGNDVEAPNDRLQWSMAAALGAEYRLQRHISLYGEAGARWYIDNHSSVDTYFKAHPIAPHLQVGLRFSIR